MTHFIVAQCRRTESSGASVARRWAIQIKEIAEWRQ
jgi:hypothetical protein